MKYYHNLTPLLAILISSLSSFAFAASTVKDTEGQSITLEAGHSSLKKWVLPETPPSPDDNKSTPARVDLGKMLFFDPRMSGTGQVTCSSCHLPERGWTDGMPTTTRFMGKVMPVASPTITNLGYNTIFMWDGRMPTLEKQAAGGQGIKADINAGTAELGIPEGGHIDKIKKVPGYQKAFETAYPGEGITKESIAKAIAAFERSVVSNNSPFDKWIKGNKSALTEQQVRGFGLFIDPNKANCSACHSAPNFTDNGFHNIGLKSFGTENADLGRFKQKALPSMKGAFKTPTIRDATLTAPYFHDGSAAQLKDVVDHYVTAGVVRTNLSPNMKPLGLSTEDKQDLIAFLQALTSDHGVFVYPVLPN
jgi:cytochrome c peroxidase